VKRTKSPHCICEVICCNREEPRLTMWEKGVFNRPAQRNCVALYLKKLLQHAASKRFYYIKRM
jgi:hypothetical protein